MIVPEEKNNNISKFIRTMVLIIPLFLLAIFAGEFGIHIMFFTLLTASAFLFFKKYLWVLVVLSAPSLCLGTIINIPIIANWNYEARLAEIFILIVALLYFLELYLNKKFTNIKIDAISFILYLYLLVALVSFLHIVDFRLFVFGMKTIIYSLLAFFLTRQLIDSASKMKWFFYGISATVIMLSLQLFYKFYALGFSAKFFFERNTILLPIGPIATTAAILALLIPITFAFYFQLGIRRMESLFVVLAAVLGTTAVFLSLGKGAIASLSLGFLYLFFKLKNKRLSFILMGLWFLFFAYFLLNPFLSGLLLRIKTTLVDNNTEYRLLEYKTSWQIIKTHPWFGVGAGQQLQYFKKILNFDTAQLINNYFVQAMIDFGVIGLSLAIALFSVIMKRAKSITKNLQIAGSKYAIMLYGFSASLLVAFLNGLVEVTFFALPYAIIFWLLMGVNYNIQEMAKNSD